MNFPPPNEWAKQEGYNPFPPRWEKWLSALRERILAVQPRAGRHVTTDVHPGKGTVINIDDTAARRKGAPPPGGPTGACCIDGGCAETTEAACVAAGGTYQGDDTTCAGLAIDCGDATSGACCKDGACTIETPNDCAAADGMYQGDDTTCEEVDCEQATTGACCVGTDCTIETPGDCDGLGGIYQGDNTDCDPNPCEICCQGCAMQNPDDGLYYLTREVHIVGTSSYEHYVGSNCNGYTDVTTRIDVDPIGCTATLSCSGGGSTEAPIGTPVFTGTWAEHLGPHCGWSDSDYSPATPVGFCGGCDLTPCPPSGFTEDYADDCASDCTENDPPFSVGSREISVTVSYSNPCNNDC